MEDKGIAIENFNNDPNKILFGLFDGHGGGEVSKFLQDNFGTYMKQMLPNNNNYFDMFGNLFKILDDKINSLNCPDVGSTATIVYIEKQDNNNIINNNKNNSINSIINLKRAKSFKFNDKLRINIAIIGKRKCGKSALIKSFLAKSFENDNIDTTLDIFGKRILIYGQEVFVVISEVSQDKSNFQLAKEIITAAHIIFICYSLEDDFEKRNEVKDYLFYHFHYYNIFYIDVHHLGYHYIHLSL